MLSDIPDLRTLQIGPSGTIKVVATSVKFMPAMSVVVPAIPKMQELSISYFANPFVDTA